MHPRFMTMVALLLPALALAADSAPAPAQKADPQPATEAARKTKLDLAVRQLALDDQIMSNLDRAATREKELSPRKLFPDTGTDLPLGTRVSISLRPDTTTSHSADRTTTRCDLDICRVYDHRGRVMYTYRAARLGIDVPATRELWDACQSRQNDMLSTFERADRCSGIRSRVPSPWDPAPRAWP
jgi:hypothetical protein